MKRKNTKESSKRSSKMREKLDMYDMIIASSLDRDSIVIPDDELDSRHLAVGFSCIASMKYVSKYFLITDMEDYIKCQLYSLIRRECLQKGVLIDFFTYSDGHKIDWTSSEMVNKLKIWKRYYEREDDGDVFNYRDKKATIDNKERIILSTKYLNEAELKYRRTLAKVFIVVRITAGRDRESISNMYTSIRRFKEVSRIYGIRVKELRVNMLDWCRLLNPLSLFKGEMYNKVPKRIMTDDVEANFISMRQGRVGDSGVPLGMDIMSGETVMYKFKGDPEAPENVLIGGETGSGKSYLVKPLIISLLASNMCGTIMDYEGDEYINLARYLAASNKEDVCIINIGKNSEYYFDPCPIPHLTGQKDIDSSLKQTAMEYIKLIFTKIIHSEDEQLNNAEAKIISLGIQRMYDSVGVTEDSNTWTSRSEVLRLSDVYYEIKNIAASKEFYNADGSTELNDAAVNISKAAGLYFEPGEIHYGTFGKPLSLERIYKAKLIVFAFGVKGQVASVTDKKILALKQISLAYVNNLISNNCKYIKKCYNFKIWEEGQRWLNLAGSSEIIINEVTGGRKRGDINFIITNDISALLDEADRLGETLTANIQHYFIGKIPKESIRQKFCKEFQVTNILPELDKIANAKDKARGRNKYNHAFVLVMQNGCTPIVRVELPPAITKSRLFSNKVKEDI